MQTLAIDNQFIPLQPNGYLYFENFGPGDIKSLSSMDKRDCLQAVYRGIFKDNRNIDFHHNDTLDSASNSKFQYTDSKGQVKMTEGKGFQSSF